jgi:beta-glucosidase
MTIRLLNGEEGGWDVEGVSSVSDLPEARPHIHETRHFPTGFLWGTATSAHQVEGGTDNDWSEWEKVPGNIRDNTDALVACDHYRRYEEDFDLAKGLGQNAHRLSLEWSRIEPEEGRWDMNEVVHYRRVLESLKRRGLNVMLTAWHFTEPKWFAAKGGWKNRDAPRLFARYCEFVAREYGDIVDHWITINEPMIYIGQSYSVGEWPPCERGVVGVFRVFRNLCRAHNAAFAVMHAALDRPGARAWVGIAQNCIAFEPYRRHSLMDNLYVWFADRVCNHQFFLWTRGRHDFIGINYYFYYRVKYVPKNAAQFFFEVHTENREVSDLGWEINPQGIFEVVMAMWRYRLPIFITENGVASADDGKRPRALVSTVKELYHAIKAGADVRGYFHWSLLDNFEWDKGFKPRFGLVAVDYATQKRTPRRSAYVYQEICEENGLPHRLLRFAGHSVRW